MSKKTNRSRPRGVRQNDAEVRGGKSIRRGKVRYAVIGLGHIAQAAVLPAFAHARGNSELAALVTNDAQKLRQLGKRYRVAALYRYAGLRRCLVEEGIDAVYIAAPNSEHRRFVAEAASAGVHVLCEKPLGVTGAECKAMIRDCERARVSLMVAYRLHFEAANLRALALIRSGKIGAPRLFNSVFSYQIKDPNNIRLRRKLGGGPLHDIGIYCLNAARSVFRAEPIEVHAWSAAGDDKRFREVDETVSVHLRFPGDRIATFQCSFGVAAAGWYEVIGTKGSLCLDPAFEYAEGLGLSVTVGEKTQERHFAKRDQFAAELAYFSDCILSRHSPEPSGWEGLADVQVIDAIQRSISSSRPVKIRIPSKARHPQPGQRIDRPAVPREPRLVHARSASG